MTSLPMGLPRPYEGDLGDDAAKGGLAPITLDIFNCLGELFGLPGRTIENPSSLNKSHAALQSSRREIRLRSVTSSIFSGMYKLSEIRLLRV